MTYYKPALFLICLSVFLNDRIEGMKLVEVEGQTKTIKDGRSIDSHHSGIVPSLFSRLVNDFPSDNDNHVHHAGWYTRSYMFEGTRARISVWDIQNVSYNSESSVFIAVMNENGSSVASMFAGFHVNPSLYSGSTSLRLFAGWKTVTDPDGHACYSTAPDCPGFVVSNVSGAPIPGQPVAPLSTYDGQDRFMTLSIKKDEKTQDWSLYRDDDSNPILIGWWPKTIFNNTFDLGTTVAWAGGVLYPANETSPPMGSGHVGAEGANKAAYISNIKFFDRFGGTQDPEPSKVEGLTDRPDCFATDDFKYNRGRLYNFYYGGPSGCKN